jgi:hypothetical protein
MKSGVLLLALLSTTRSASGQDPDRPIRSMGEFSNMRFTEDHAYGYEVELWRDRESVIGLFFASEGPQGDTPTGLIENVKFNPRTGAISFTAKLTIGVNILSGGRQEPSRDLFEFSGVLSATRLTGMLKRSGHATRVGLKTVPKTLCFRSALTPNGSAVPTRS